MRYLLALLLISSTTLAQPLTETQKLTSLAKVWGFLKYYHPAVATGQHDWDEQLVRLIPAVQQAHDREELSALYATVLNALGAVDPCRKCLPEANVPTQHRRNLDLLFLTDSVTLTSALRNRLAYIKDNRNQRANYYVQHVKDIGNTSYENEKLYADRPMPNASYRLLALFRYWNIIQYFFPYKYATDGNWNEVLSDLIPVFQAATTEQTYQKALYQMVARIQDSHGFMLTTDKSRCMRCELGRLWLPVGVQLLNNKAVITRLYADSLSIPRLLTIGTVISRIDGETVQARIERLRPYVSASNNPTLLRDVAGLIGLGSAEQVSLTIELGERDTTITVHRYPYQKLGRNGLAALQALYPVSRWMADSVGYVNMGKLTSKQVDSVMISLLTARAIIFDLRNYPQGTYWLIGRYLVDKPSPFAQFTGPDGRLPGVFQPVGTAKLPRPGKQQLYRGKVIVLINEETQSHAEFTAMAFQTNPNVTLVGSPTAGADGNISWVPLPGGYRTAFSGIGVYYPDGRKTQRVGIVPDILIQPTSQGIRERRDEVLERAMTLIRDSK